MAVVRAIEVFLKVLTTVCMICIAVICLNIGTTLPTIIRFPMDIDAYTLQRICYTMGILAAYFAIIPWIFDSYIDFSRIFIRLHNLIVLWVLFAQLFKAAKQKCLLKYAETTYHGEFKMLDCFDKEDIDTLLSYQKRISLLVVFVGVLCLVLTFICIWKIIKFYMFYFLVIDI